MKKRRGWGGMKISGLLLFIGIGCSVQQQHKVLGTVGALIPGSSTSVITSRSSSTTAEPSTGAESPAQAVSSPPVDVERTDAQWVLRTVQRAMTDYPSPFQECLNNPPCKLAFTAHLIRLQQQAGGTLELPPVYDRYDLKRGKE